MVHSTGFAPITANETWQKRKFIPNFPPFMILLNKKYRNLLTSVVRHGQFSLGVAFWSFFFLLHRTILTTFHVTHSHRIYMAQYFCNVSNFFCQFFLPKSVRNKNWITHSAFRARKTISESGNELTYQQCHSPSLAGTSSLKVNAL